MLQSYLLSYINLGKYLDTDRKKLNHMTHVWLARSQKTCSSPRRAVRSHYLVCSENSLLIVGIGPILNKELELIFRSDRSDRTCVYSQVSGLQDKLYIYKRKETCIVFWILKCNAQCQALCIQQRNAKCIFFQYKNVTQSTFFF